MALEVCVDTLRSALNAFKGGAARIELCSALYLGGLTPSVGLFKVARKNVPSHFKIFVMIRPKAGEDYVYDEGEIDVMLEDIKIFKEIGADGFVFGCLNQNRDVDIEACEKLLEAAKGYPCTFHRAFDVVKNPEESLSTIASLGFSRILTSGQKPNAYMGRDLIKKLVSIANQLSLDIIIVAGGGIDVTNLKNILNHTKVKEFHGTAKTRSHEQFDCKKLTWETEESVVREMIEVAKNIL